MRSTGGAETGIRNSLVVYLASNGSSNRNPAKSGNGVRQARDAISCITVLRLKRVSCILSNTPCACSWIRHTTGNQSVETVSLTGVDVQRFGPYVYMAVHTTGRHKDSVRSNYYETLLYQTQVLLCLYN